MNRSLPFVTDYDNNGKADLGLLYGYANSTTKLWILRSDGTKLTSAGAVWESGVGNWLWEKTLVP
jgi:hypothetical protein